jgi:hypothetical protein
MLKKRGKKERGEQAKFGSHSRVYAHNTPITKSGTVKHSAVVPHFTPSLGLIISSRSHKHFYGAVLI